MIILDAPRLLNNREQQLNFIKENWDSLAAFAWAGYLEQGAGAVVIQHEETTQGEWGTPTLINCSFCYYVSKSNLITQGVILKTDTSIGRMVSEYNPKTEVTFFFFGKSSKDCKHYRICVQSSLKTPPDAYNTQLSMFGNNSGGTVH